MVYENTAHVLPGQNITYWLGKTNTHFTNKKFQKQYVTMFRTSKYWIWNYVAQIPSELKALVFQGHVGIC